MTKHQRGDRQLRVEDVFDRARAVNESSAALRASNKCKTDVVIPENVKRTVGPGSVESNRFAPDGDGWQHFSSKKPGQW